MVYAYLAAILSTNPATRCFQPFFVATHNWWNHYSSYPRSWKDPVSACLMNRIVDSPDPKECAWTRCRYRKFRCPFFRNVEFEINIGTILCSSWCLRLYAGGLIARRWLKRYVCSSFRLAIFAGLCWTYLYFVTFGGLGYIRQIDVYRIFRLYLPPRLSIISLIVSKKGNIRPQIGYVYSVFD